MKAYNIELLLQQQQKNQYQTYCLQFQQETALYLPYFFFPWRFHKNIRVFLKQWKYSNFAWGKKNFAWELFWVHFL